MLNKANTTSEINTKKGHLKEEVLAQEEEEEEEEE